MFSLVFLALIVSSYIPVVKVFNLDIISPDLRTGPPKSLFGFAVVSSSVRQQWYGCSKKFIFRSKFYFVGLMLVHLELYLVVNDSHQFYQIVLIMSQMAVCLGIFLSVQMAQINVVRFLLRVIDRSIDFLIFIMLCLFLLQMTYQKPCLHSIQYLMMLGSARHL